MQPERIHVLAPARRSRELIPWRWTKRFAVGIDGRLHVSGEVGIGHRNVAQLLFMRPRQCDALADFPARTLRRLDDGHGTMVLLHDHLDAFLDLGEHSIISVLSCPAASRLKTACATQSSHRQVAGDPRFRTPPYGPICPEMGSSGRRQSLLNCPQRGLTIGVLLFARYNRNGEGYLKQQTKWML